MSAEGVAGGQGYDRAVKPVEYAAAATVAGILTVGLAGVLGIFIDNGLAAVVGVVLWLALSWFFAHGLKRQLRAQRTEEQRLAQAAMRDLEEREREEGR